MTARMPPHLRSQREGLAKAFPQLTFAIMPKKLFIYRRGAQVPYVTFDRDGQIYRTEGKTAGSVREALEWAMSKI